MITIPLQLPDKLARQVIPLQERLPEIIELGNEYRSMQANDPFIGGLSVKEYFALPDAEQERLWAEQHRMDIDDFEERDVRPDATISPGSKASCAAA